jgi:hypothetical protein
LLVAIHVSTGKYYDSGGPSGNYRDNEYSQHLIQCDSSFNAVVVQLAELAILFTQCDNDFLKIYDGPTAASSLLFLSGCPKPIVSSSNPLVLVSTTTQVYIKFTADNLGPNAGGYTIQYFCSHLTTVSSPSGTLYDTGGAGGHYGNSEIIATRITCPLGRGPQLTFTQLDIDGTMPSCSSDNLKIISGGVVKNTFCGTWTDPFLPQVSVGASSALILFNSDSTITNGGYSLDYECVLITSGKRYFSLFEWDPCTTNLKLSLLYRCGLRQRRSHWKLC